MSFLRFLMLLSLVVWIGGLIFFAFVMAPSLFDPRVLPTHQLAGNVVSRTLGILHWMAIVCGVVFAGTSMIDSRIVNGAAHPFAASNLIVYLMIVLTLVGMFGIASRMQSLKDQMGMIDAVPQDDARRMEFNRLHVWSTRVEGTVLILRTGAAVPHGATIIVKRLRVARCARFKFASFFRHLIASSISKGAERNHENRNHRLAAGRQDFSLRHADQAADHSHRTVARRTWALPRSPTTVWTAWRPSTTPRSWCTPAWNTPTSPRSARKP